MKIDENEIEPICPPPFPFDLDEKIFVDYEEDSGEILGGSYSYNDCVQRLKDISGIGPELMESA